VSASTNCRFPEQVQFVAPRGINAALDRLADRLHRTKSELARQAVLHVLEVNGVKLSDRQVPA
jgi:predicted transcriptional regulator